MMIFKKIFIIFIIFFTFVIPSLSFAEFKETSLNVFQNMNEEYKIIITDEGIFIIQTKKIGLKSFSLADLTKEKIITHCFLKYNLMANKYEKLLIGKNVFDISGSFNLKIGNLHVNVDGLNKYSSYVVYDKNIEDSMQGILGVIGATVVVNTAGSSFVALLEANAMSSSEVLTYEIKNEKLFLDNKEVKQDKKLGNIIDSSTTGNTCLQENSIILNEDNLKEMKKIGEKSGNDLTEIEKIFSSRKSQDVIKDFLIIRIEKSSIILLDYINADIKIMKKLGDSSSSKRSICYIKSIDID